MKDSHLLGECYYVCAHACRVALKSRRVSAVAPPSKDNLLPGGTPDSKAEQQSQQQQLHQQQVAAQLSAQEQQQAAMMDANGTKLSHCM